MGRVSKWKYQADIVVVGYGGAGAVTAITAHDLGAKVIILEKHKADTRTMINHTPSSRMCGGGFLCATDAKKAADYLYWTSWGATPRDCCEVMGQYMVTNETYMRSLGGEGIRMSKCEYEDVAPGGDAICCLPEGNGPPSSRFSWTTSKERNPGALCSPGHGTDSESRNKEVLGVVAEKGGRSMCQGAEGGSLIHGGHEWDEDMKLNTLRAYPSYFYSNPGNEGDGIRMGQKAGAALWHMNAISGRVIPYVQGIKPAFGGLFPTPFILVNKYGKRFATEPGDQMVENTGPMGSGWSVLNSIRGEQNTHRYPVTRSLTRPQG
jgi:hypothetical protein